MQGPRHGEKQWKPASDVWWNAEKKHITFKREGTAEGYTPRNAVQTPRHGRNTSRDAIQAPSHWEEKWRPPSNVDNHWGETQMLSQEMQALA